MKKILLYLQVAVYIGMGAAHLVAPAQYLPMVPAWLPAPLVLIYGSGVVEILLALLLLPLATRRLAAYLICAMLVAYLLLIHVPQSIQFYQSGSAAFGSSIGRILFQFVFLAWAYWYTADKASVSRRQSRS